MPWISSSNVSKTWPRFMKTWFAPPFMRLRPRMWPCFLGASFMVPFRMNIGKEDGVDMLSLIRFIMRKGRVSEHLIGDVTVSKSTSDVRLHKSIAFYAMKDLENCNVQNKRVKIDLIR